MWYWRRTAYDGAIAASAPSFATLNEYLKGAFLDGLADQAVGPRSVLGNVITSNASEQPQTRTLANSAPRRLTRCAWCSTRTSWVTMPRAHILITEKYSSRGTRAKVMAVHRRKILIPSKAPSYIGHRAGRRIGRRRMEGECRDRYCALKPACSASSLGPVPPLQVTSNEQAASETKEHSRHDLSHIQADAPPNEELDDSNA
jgi:hypothetical protein